jgi:hypothetical protein
MKKYKITACLDKVIEAKNKKEAKKIALGLINGNKKDWSIDIDNYDPSKERNKLWIVDRIHSKLTDKLDPLEYMHDFDREVGLPPEVTDLEYSEALLAYIKDALFKDEGPWNISGMADMVIEMMAEDKDMDLDECVYETVYGPVKSRYPKDLKEVIGAVTAEARKRLEA